MTTFSIAINAGGKSSRMGTDKAFVPIAGMPIIEHIWGRVQQLGQTETFIIANKPEAYQQFGCPIYGDVLPDSGSLGGIYTALHHSQSDYTLLLACDMPFIAPPLIRYMWSLAQDASFDVIVPRVNQYPQGFFALYHKNCLPHIHEKLTQKAFKVIGFYDAVRVRYVDEPEYQPFIEPEKTFFNVNTPDDLQQAEKLAKTQE